MCTAKESMHTSVPNAACAFAVSKNVIAAVCRSRITNENTLYHHAVRAGTCGARLRDGPGRGERLHASPAPARSTVWMVKLELRRERHHQLGHEHPRAPHDLPDGRRVPVGLLVDGVQQALDLVPTARECTSQSGCERE